MPAYADPEVTGNALQPAMYLHLPVTDPEALAALAEVDEGRDRQELALTALKIGLLSLKAARGTLDGAVLRREGDHLLQVLEERFGRHRELLDESLAGTLRTYSDPSDGAFAERVQRLLRQDGELATVIQSQVQTARQSLDTLLAQHLGEGSALRALLEPGESNAFIDALRRQVDVQLQQQSDAITAEFSLDRGDSALSRLVRELKARHVDLEQSLGRRVESVVGEFSLDKEDSALSRLVGRVEQAQRQINAQFSLDNPESALRRIVAQIAQLEQAQQQRAHDLEVKVTGMLERMVTRREAESRSTLHGGEFERRVGEVLRDRIVAADDVFEAVGETAGVIPRCKVGDFVITLGPDSAAPGARIAIEAKESERYTLKSTLDEADEARRNRSASVCLFVHSAKTAPAGLPELHRWGADVVVVWDADDPMTDVRLKAGVLLSRALAVRAGGTGEAEAASFAEVDAAIEAIRKQIGGFEEIQTSARTICNGGQKILDRARIMENEIERRLAAIVEQMVRLRGAG